MSRPSRYAWFVVAVFFTFMLLHQADKLLIGPLTEPIMRTFGITRTQMERGLYRCADRRCPPLPHLGLPLRPVCPLQTAGAGVLHLGLHHLAERHRPHVSGLPDHPGLHRHRRLLLPRPLQPHRRLFRPLRAGSGLRHSPADRPHRLPPGDDDGADAPGRHRLAGCLLHHRWSGGAPGRGHLLRRAGDAARRSEPELADLEQIGIYRFNWKTALGLFRIRSLILLFIQGFFGVFPWNTITYWFFYYLETERGYSSDAVLMTMAPAVLVLASGYLVGGSLGDFFFRRTPRGRMLVASSAVLIGAVCSGSPWASRLKTSSFS